MPTHPIYTNQISSYPAASRKRWKSSPLEQKKTSKSLGSPTKNPNHHMPETPFFCCVFVFVSMASNKFIPPPHPPQKKTHNKNHQCCHVLCLNMYIYILYIYTCIYIYIIYIHIFKTKKASEIFPPPPPRNLKNLHNVDRSSSVNSTSEIDRLLPPTFNLIHFHLEGLRTWMDVCFAVWMLLRNVYRAKIVRFHQPRTDPEIFRDFLY